MRTRFGFPFVSEWAARQALGRVAILLAFAGVLAGRAPLEAQPALPQPADHLALLSSPPSAQPPAQPLAPEQQGASPADACRETIPGLYRRVSPSVVSVAAMSINAYSIENHGDRVAGSGVIIDGAGLILTNSHVVLGRQVIMVMLDDGTALPAQLVGADPIFDIALLRVPKPQEGTLPAAELGDSDHLVVGEEVYTIGNPFGLNQTLTRGIVSAVNRILPGVSLSLTEPMIQTDAAINPGNSGGPLVDHCGRIVGITTALLPEAQNIGFAVPVNLVKEVMPSLTANGRVIRPWLGVQGQLVVPALRSLLRMPLTEGFLVEVAEPGSPAEKAGIRGGTLDLSIGGQPVLLGGDIITEINGSAVSDPEKLRKALEALKVGAPVHLTVFSEEKTRQLDVVITERPLLPGDIRAHRSSAPASVAPQQAPAPAGNRRTSF